MTTSQEAIRTAVSATGLKPVAITRDANQYAGKLSKNAHTVAMKNEDDANTLDLFLSKLQGIASRRTGASVKVQEDKRPNWRR